MKWIFLILLFTPFAHAADCPSLEGKAGIIIGGTLSTTADMAACYSDLMSVGIDDGARMADCFAKRIDQLRLTQKFIVAGHSSGSASAERIVRQVKNKSKVHLKLLEGYGDVRAHAGVETSCYYAKSDEARGMNADAMLDRKVCPNGATAIEAPQCGKNPLCLHISLVNRNVSPDVSRETVTNALKNCTGNCAWIGVVPTSNCPAVQPISGTNPITIQR